MKNSNDTIWNQTSDLLICSTVHVRICIIDNFPGVKINLVGFSKLTLWDIHLKALNSLVSWKTSG